MEVLQDLHPVVARTLSGGQQTSLLKNPRLSGRLVIEACTCVVQVWHYPSPRLALAVPAAAAAAAAAALRCVRKQV